MEEQLIQEVLTRFAEVENVGDITVEIGIEPCRELHNLPEEVTQVRPHKIKLINNDRVIETYFSITEHEFKNYARELSENIKQKIKGWKLEEVVITEPVDADGPISYSFVVYTKVDDFLADMFIMNNEG